MAKYRTKPVVIEAVRFDASKPAIEWPEGVELFGIREGTGEMYEVPQHHAAMWHAGVKTLEGIMKVSDGDYIITRADGERYPCKPDIFAATYEPA